MRAGGTIVPANAGVGPITWTRENGRLARSHAATIAAARIQAASVVRLGAASMMTPCRDVTIEFTRAAMNRVVSERVRVMITTLTAEDLSVLRGRCSGSDDNLQHGRGPAADEAAAAVARVVIGGDMKQIVARRTEGDVS